MECLDKWQLADYVVGMCFDTTSCNTGSALGACALLLQKLGRPLFPVGLSPSHTWTGGGVCSAFTAIFGPSSGPDIALFKRFPSSWNFIDQSKFDPVVPGELRPELEDSFFSSKEQAVLFCTQHLEAAQPRDDYRELLELILIFYGGCPQRGIQFMQPGALHRARWMARVIYAIKMYLFWNQFRLTGKKLTGLKRFTAFTAVLYIKSWFRGPSTIAAPAGDLGFLKALASFDSVVAKTTSKKWQIISGIWVMS